MALLYDGRERERRRRHTVARVRAYQQRQRDEYGRFAVEGEGARDVMLSVRLTPGEREAIVDVAASREMTVTALIVAAVGAYGRGRDRQARTMRVDW